MNKELEKAKEQVQIFIDTGKEYFRAYGECYITEDELKSVEAVLQALENSIPKEKVEETFEYIEDYVERLNGPDEDIEYIKNKKQELLEGE